MEITAASHESGSDGLGAPLVGTLATAVAGAEPGEGLAAGIAALAAAGVTAHVDRGSNGTPRPGALPLVRAGRTVGTLTLSADVDPDTAAALASIFALALDLGGPDPLAGPVDLLSVGIAAGEASSLDEALALVVESCLALSGADGTTAVVWNEALDAGVIRAGAGKGARFVGEPIRLGENVASEALRTRRPVVLRGETGDGLDGPFAEEVANLACTLAVPVELDGVPLATLQAGWHEPPSEREVERAIALLQTVSALGGLSARAGGERAQARDVAVLEAVLESVGEALWVHTADRRLVNAAARRMLALDGPVEVPPADVPVRYLDGATVPHGDQPSVRASATGQPQRFRNRAMRSDGVERIFDGTAAPVITPGGDDLGVVMSFRDVTEEHSSTFLRDRLLQRLFESLPTAIAVFDADTREARSANRAFLELVGRELDDVLGRRPPYPWWTEGHELTAPNEEVDRLEWMYRRKDGTLVPVELTRLVIRSERDDPLAFVVLATDLSERRRFEQQLVQTGKLAAIGELAAGVAHEINNPLFAILGLVEFLLKDAEPGSKAENRLQLIQQTGLEIKEIVKALLDFARERTDDLTLVSLGDVAGQTVDLVRRATSAKGIEIVERYPEETVLVKASATQLKQVFLNLLTNAQHALPEGGTITIDVGGDGEHATATITDDGPGIPAEVATRIFDPFFTTKRELGGTGLGLSVSLGIAEMHGGGLSVDPVPGDGASFTLRIPLAAEAP